MYKIFIIMFLFKRDPEGFDSITINTDNGMPLRFETREECGSYIDKHLDKLKEFGKEQFNNNGVVKSIHCIIDKNNTGV